MIKKISFLLICVMQVLFAVAQDEQQNINVLINNQKPTEVEFMSCKLSVEASRIGSSGVSLDINLDNTTLNDIFLFGHAYSEKELKKHKIRFDKKSYGTTSRELLRCEGVGGDEIFQINPNSNRMLKIDNISADRKKCEIPLYIAKSKNNKKFLIMRRSKIILTVTLIEDKYDDFNQRCQNLLNQIGRLTICPDKKHRLTKEEQKGDYPSSIDNLIKDIDNYKSSLGWKDSDEEFQRYKDLKSQLRNVTYKEKVCAKCEDPVPIPDPGPIPNPIIHRPCKYCNMTPKTVEAEMERIYKKLDISVIGKKQATSDAQLLYHAFNEGCPKLTQKMNAAISIRNAVMNYYNDIQNHR